MENLDTLQGVNIEEDSIRYYPDSKYFASILGYTGVISQDEYDALDEKEQDSYSLTDVVGKAGLEQTLDKTLQGEKGEIKLYVNSVGKVIESKQGKRQRQEMMSIFLLMPICKRQLMISWKKSLPESSFQSDYVSDL